MDEQVASGLMKRTEREQAAAWIGAYRERLYRLAYAIVANREVAEDVTQETLARAYRHRGKLNQVRSVEAWLRTICVRQAINAMRVQGPSRSIEDTADPDSTTEALAVRHTLSRLRPEHSAILALVLYEGLSYAETADTLGIPEGTVASRLNAARAAFAKLWEDEQ